MRINQDEVEQVIKQGGIEIKRDHAGNPLAYKGPFLDFWYDNYTECLRENSAENRRQVHKAFGLNEMAQTPEQEKAFKKKLAVAAQKKEKAELAAEMALQNK